MNQFLEACGASAPLQLTVDAFGANAREVHTFDLPFAIVGRAPGSDLRLDHPEVSERHAYLQLLNSRLVFLDLGSRNGIQQAGKRKKLGLVLQDPPTRIGPYRLRWIGGDPGSSDANAVELNDVDPSELAERSMSRAVVDDSDHSNDLLTLDLTHRTTRRSRVRLRGGITLIGSGADCNVRLIDPTVSNAHCSIVQTQDGTWLVDLIGNGGVKVNGRLVNHARLFEGDEVHLGASAVRVETLPIPVREAGRLGFARSARRQPVNEPAPPVAATVLHPAPRSKIEVEAVASAPVDPIPTHPATTPKPIRLADVPFSQASPNAATLLAMAELGEPAAPASVTPPPSPKATSLELAEPKKKNDGEFAVNTLGSIGLSVEQTAEIVERVVTPLLDHLGVLRQQMLDEFHQARVMMFETIGSLQQEQSAVFNSELEQLRKLAGELETHRDELDRQAEKLAEAAAESVVVAKDTIATVNASASAKVAMPGPSAFAVNEQPAPWPLRSPTNTLIPKSIPYRITPDVPGPTLEPTVVTSNAVGNGNGVGNGNPDPFRTARRPHDEQVHAALCDRITRLKEDHQTRWQKLLGLFPGAASGKPAG